MPRRQRILPPTDAGYYWPPEASGIRSTGPAPGNVAYPFPGGLPGGITRNDPAISSASGLPLDIPTPDQFPTAYGDSIGGPYEPISFGVSDTAAPTETGASGGQFQQAFRSNTILGFGPDDISPLNPQSTGEPTFQPTPSPAGVFTQDPQGNIVPAALRQQPSSPDIAVQQPIPAAQVLLNNNQQPPVMAYPNPASGYGNPPSNDWQQNAMAHSFDPWRGGFSDFANTAATQFGFGAGPIPGIGALNAPSAGWQQAGDLSGFVGSINPSNAFGGASRVFIN